MSGSSARRATSTSLGVASSSYGDLSRAYVDSEYDATGRYSLSPADGDDYRVLRRAQMRGRPSYSASSGGRAAGGRDAESCSAASGTRERTAPSSARRKGDRTNRRSAVPAVVKPSRLAARKTPAESGKTSAKPARARSRVRTRVRSTSRSAKTERSSRVRSRSPSADRVPRVGNLERRGGRPPWVLHLQGDGKFRVRWGSVRKYRIGAHLGSGAHGDVFRAQHRLTGVAVAVKEVNDAPQARIRTRKEIHTLLRVHDGPNIVRLIDVCLDAERRPHLVFDLIEADRWQELHSQLNAIDIALYSYKLLLALAYAHRRNVLHRDIKPQNILIDHSRRQLRLIDWGCAGVWKPGKSFTRFPGTKPFKAPEMLLHVHQYTAAVDVWSAGVVLASLLFKQRPFFAACETDDEQLGVIAELLGTEALEKYCQRARVRMPSHAARVRKARSLRTLITKRNRSLVSSAALNLLKKLIRYDPATRLSASQALAHAYFDPVREEGDQATQSDDASSASYDDPAYVPHFTDADVRFGIGYDTGLSSSIGYTTSDSGEGFFEVAEDDG